LPRARPMVSFAPALSVAVMPRPRPAAHAAAAVFLPRLRASTPARTPAAIAALPSPRPAARPAEAPTPDVKSGEAVLSECQQRLHAFATGEVVPHVVGPGACGGTDMVRLKLVQLPDGGTVALKPQPLLRCEMAFTLATWIRDDAAPVLARVGEVLREIETADDYDCRSRNRIPGAKLSEHAKGNAIDVRALALADRRVLTLTDSSVPRDLRESLRASACARFTTVLGPGSDGYHERHIHLDLRQRHGNFHICEWAVRGGQATFASVGVPLPQPRPPSACRC